MTIYEIQVLVLGNWQHYMFASTKTLADKYVDNLINEGSYKNSEIGIQSRTVKTERNSLKTGQQITRWFHPDSGHGWLAVKYKDLVELGVLDKISSCSYMKGDTVYLEEDCDATVYVDALKALNIDLKVKNGKHYDRSPIRTYDIFDPNAFSNN